MRRRRAQVLTIGDELLVGDVVDSNCADLGQWCLQRGLEVIFTASVGDDPQAIAAELSAAAGRADLVLVTGGLGPTADDRTTAAFADWAGVPLVIEREEHARICRKFSAGSGAGSDDRLEIEQRQAWLPRGAITLTNPVGIAPGFIWQKDRLQRTRPVSAKSTDPVTNGRTSRSEMPEQAAGLVPPQAQRSGEPSTIFAVLPGVPRELRAMLEGELSQRLGELWADGGAGDADVFQPRARDRIWTIDISEAEIQAIVQRCLRELALPESVIAELHLRAHHPYVELWFDRARLERATIAVVNGYEQLLSAVVDGLGSHLLGSSLSCVPKAVAGRGDIFELPSGSDAGRRAHAALCAASATVSTAESCTAGWIAGRLANAGGSSAFLLGGIVAYANAVKQDQLGVLPSTLEAHGAVSAEVVCEMARGCRKRLGSDWGIAVSGIAGPGGATPGKPVGTVYVAVAGAGSVYWRRLQLSGDRTLVRQATVDWSLELLCLLLATEPVQRHRFVVDADVTEGSALPTRIGLRFHGVKHAPS